MALTNRQRRVIHNSRAAVRETSGAAAATAWRKAYRKSMRNTPGALTNKEQRLIKQAGQAISTIATPKEAKGAKAVLRRASRKG